MKVEDRWVQSTTVMEAHNPRLMQENQTSLCCGAGRNAACVSLLTAFYHLQVCLCSLFSQRIFLPNCTEASRCVPQVPQLSEYLTCLTESEFQKKLFLGFVYFPPGSVCSASVEEQRKKEKAASCLILLRYNPKLSFSCGTVTA